MLLNNVIGILGAIAMGASKVSELYELLIMGRYLIGVNCGMHKCLSCIVFLEFILCFIDAIPCHNLTISNCHFQV